MTFSCSTKNSISESFVGACESSLACSTCHVILEEAVFDMLPEPCEEEEDMLDMAFGLTATSRLGCQVIVSEALSNAMVMQPWIHDDYLILYISI
jgi:ferredoxin